MSLFRNVTPDYLLFIDSSAIKGPNQTSLSCPSSSKRHKRWRLQIEIKTIYCKPQWDKKVNNDTNNESIETRVVYIQKLLTDQPDMTLRQWTRGIQTLCTHTFFFLTIIHAHVLLGRRMALDVI